MGRPRAEAAVRRVPQEEAGNGEVMTGRIVFVRHGETTWNRLGRCQGWHDVPLDETGEDQARRVAERLASWRLDQVVSSDLSRARRTAELIAERHGLAVATVPGLREFRFGECEGLSLRDIQATPLGRHWARWKRGDTDDALPGGEHQDEVRTRVVQAIDQVLSALCGGTSVVVGHGSSLRVGLCARLGFDVGCWRNLVLENGSMTVVEAWRGRLRLAALNDTCHLGGSGTGFDGAAARGGVRDWTLSAEEAG
jgi:phosphoserine phosphatase